MKNFILILKALAIAAAFCLFGEARAEFEKVPVPKDGFKAEYSQEVENYPALRGMNLVSCFKYDERDIADLAAWKANLIRWQISRNYKRPGKNRDIADYDKWIDSEIEKIRKISQMARKHGIRIVIEMHTPVGGVAKNSDMMMFYEPPYAEHFVEVWRKIARALKGDDTIFAYDLINEPVQSRPPVIDYLTLQYAAAKAVREIDPSKPIIVASDGWNNPATFKKLRPPMVMLLSKASEGSKVSALLPSL